MGGIVPDLRGAVALLCALLLASPVWAAPALSPPVPDGSPAQPGAWEPGTGLRTPASTDELRFHGWYRLDPLRVHLKHGGFFEGGLGGVDRTRDRLLIVHRGGSMAIDLHLVTEVTPLGLMRDRLGPDGELLAEPEVDAAPAVSWVLRPTWRSHLGAAMSAIIPGTGQFLQKSEQWLGGVFLATWSFLVAGGLLAMFAPGNQTQSVRTGMAAGFLGVAGGFNVLAAVHAHQAGRERTRQVQRAEATTGVGGLTHRPIGE